MQDTLATVIVPLSTQQQKWLPEDKIKSALASHPEREASREWIRMRGCLFFGCQPFSTPEPLVSWLHAQKRRALGSRIVVNNRDVLRTNTQKVVNKRFYKIFLKSKEYEMYLVHIPVSDTSTHYFLPLWLHLYLWAVFPWGILSWSTLVHKIFGRFHYTCSSVSSSSK